MNQSYQLTTVLNATNRCIIKTTTCVRVIVAGMMMNVMVFRCSASERRVNIIDKMNKCKMGKKEVQSA